jgi:hypothetical protein
MAFRGMLQSPGAPHCRVPGSTERSAPNPGSDVFSPTMMQDGFRACSNERAQACEFASLAGQPSERRLVCVSHRQGERQNSKRGLPDCINCGRRTGGIKETGSPPAWYLPGYEDGESTESSRPTASQQDCSCISPGSAQDDRGSLEPVVPEPVTRPAQAARKAQKLVGVGTGLSFCPLAIRINCLRSSSRGVLSNPSCTANV